MTSLCNDQVTYGDKRFEFRDVQMLIIDEIGSQPLFNIVHLAMDDCMLYILFLVIVLQCSL